MEVFLTIAISIIGSGAVFGFIQFIISRNDKKHDKQQKILDEMTDLKKTLNTKVDTLADRLDEQAAKMARANILRFDDELIAGEHHSREYFRSILDEIDTYETYCQSHTGFKNSFTIEASKHIRGTYSRLVNEGEFKP